MSRTWTDRIVGTRMAVDREFESRLEQSEFQRQEWGLVMTAVEFEIEHPEDPERARLVGDTGNIPAILPELERISKRDATGAGGGGAGGRGGGGSSSGGVFGSIKSALGMGGDDGFDESKVEAAEALVEEYTDMLQARLEENGRWDEIREAAMQGEADTDSDSDAETDPEPETDEE
jgi:hypothetical protein